MAGPHLPCGSFLSERWNPIGISKQVIYYKQLEMYCLSIPELLVFFHHFYTTFIQSILYKYSLLISSVLLSKNIPCSILPA